MSDQQATEATETPIETPTEKPAAQAKPAKPAKAAKKSAEPARGPHGFAQDDSDGWGDLPVQMREQ